MLKTGTTPKRYKGGGEYTLAACDEGVEIVDNALTPAQEAELNELREELDTTAPIAQEGAEALASLFIALSNDIDAGRDGVMWLVRRVLAVGYYSGALKKFSLQRLAGAAFCERQTIARLKPVVFQALAKHSVQAAKDRRRRVV